MPHSPPPNFAESLADGLRCLFCGYDLRDLTPSQRCSECGRLVSDSLRPPAGLRIHDQETVRRLRYGIGLWGLTYGASKLLGGILPIGLVYFQQPLVRSALVGLRQWYSPTLLTVHMLALALILYPHTGRRDRVSRCVSLAGIIGAGLTAGVGWMLTVKPFGFFASGNLLLLRSVSFSVTVMLTWVCLLRLVDARRERLLAVAAWAALIAAAAQLGVKLCGGQVIGYVTAAQLRPILGPLYAISWLVMLAVLLLFLWRLSALRHRGDTGTE